MAVPRNHVKQGAWTASLLIVLLANTGVAAQARFPQFAYHCIDTIGRKLGQTALADVDRDGDLDWIAGEADHGGSRIWWWEYQSIKTWVIDMDGDGDIDLCSKPWSTGNEHYYLENLGAGARK